MNFIYIKIMSFLVGEALANSDRIKSAVAGLVMSVLALVSAQCAVCQSFITPEISHWIVGIVGTFVVSIIAGLSHRDVAAPNETVPGEAMPDPPALADGVPGVK